MRYPLSLIGVCVVVFASSGCGTIMNMKESDGSCVPFGGVVMKMDALVDCTEIRPTTIHGLWLPGARLAANTFGLAFTLVDLPFTLVGDTLTLPWTLQSTPETGDSDPQLPLGERKQTIE